MTGSQQGQRPHSSGAQKGLPTALRLGIDAGVRVLRSGGVVAFPTDTLYGLGADYSSQDAVRRVIALKGRPQDMGLPLLLADAEQLDLVAVGITEEARALMARFWPGALTLVVPRAPGVPDLVTGGRDSVAVRIPDHPVPRLLARGLGRPITGTSANPSGQPPATTAQEVRRQLGTAVDLIIEGGPAPQGHASTIVDVTGPSLRIIREGAISPSAIRLVYPGIEDCPPSQPRRRAQS